MRFERLNRGRVDFEALGPKLFNEETSDEQRHGFLDSRSVSDVNPVPSRSAGIFQARGSVKLAPIDPIMYWPFFEIDNQIRLLVNPQPD